MHLGRGERIGLAGGMDFDGTSEPKGVGGTNKVGVEASSIADDAGILPSIAEVDEDGVVRFSGGDPNGACDAPPAIAYFHTVLIFDAQALRRAGAYVDGIVPGELRDVAREFLKPGITGIAAVVEERVELEDEFERAAICRGLRRTSR
jgi:hypothetical protein